MSRANKQSMSRGGGFLTQAVYIVGTNNENGSINLSTVTSVSYAFGPPECLIISFYGESHTMSNIQRNKDFTVNVCTAAMMTLADYVGSISGTRFVKDAIPAPHYVGLKVNAPVLEDSPYVMECHAIHTHKVGETHMITAEIVHHWVDKKLGRPDGDSDKEYMDWLDNSDLNAMDPLLYARKFYRIGEKLGGLSTPT